MPTGEEAKVVTTNGINAYYKTCTVLRSSHVLSPLIFSIYLDEIGTIINISILEIGN